MKTGQSNLLLDAKDLPTISGTRVSLRELRDTDVPSLFSIFSDPQVMRYWSTLPLTELAEAHEMLAEIREHFQRRIFFKWGIARNTDDFIIGTGTLFNLELDHRRGEIGYALGRDYWGKGYMQDALGALLDFCFTELNMHRIEADVDPRNYRSIKTLERLGFQREGHLRERWHVGGEIQDAWFYGLLRDDWRNGSTDA